jgi:hypothetical protein
LFNELLLGLQARDDEELLKRATHIVRYDLLPLGQDRFRIVFSWADSTLPTRLKSQA